LLSKVVTALSLGLPEPLRAFHLPLETRQTDIGQQPGIELPKRLPRAGASPPDLSDQANSGGQAKARHAGAPYGATLAREDRAMLRKWQ